MMQNLNIINNGVDTQASNAIPAAIEKMESLIYKICKFH